MRVSQKYKEIFRLKEMLEEAKIPFDFFAMDDDEKIREIIPDWEHWHINYPHRGDFIISAIEGIGSYGEQDDKLEIMDTNKPDDDGDTVEGWLTAEEVFERIKKDYLGRNKSEKNS